MHINRQHEETELYEIHGFDCNRMLVVPGEGKDEIIFIRLLADETWLRIFLDAGVLFVDTDSGPTPEEDLAEGEEYIDLTEKYRCKGSRIEKASKYGDVFELELLLELIFTFKQIGDNPPTILKVTDDRK